MTKKLLFPLFLFGCYSLFSQDFTSIWKTDQPGVSGNNEITIPTNAAYTYNYNVAWGDGSTDTNVAGTITHTYAVPGTYTVSISGDFPAIYFNGGGDRRKIIEILAWGTIEWQTMEDAFRGCENLNFDAIDNPDLSRVTSLKNMFRDADLFNGIINNWDISTITDISGMFAGTDTFNRPLDNWNTSAVTDMSETFSRAVLFNEPLDNWVTGAVTTMASMFSSAINFNQNINNWNVGQVTDMSAMFANARNFNSSINDWNVSEVTDMSQMFSGAVYNLPLNLWNTGKVTDMSQMFASHGTFNQPLTSWDVSSVTDMSQMFYRATAFNQPLESWAVENVTNMSGMFDGYILNMAFNQPLNGWNVGNVNDMSLMFRDCANFNQPLDTWNVGSVTNMNQMFEGADVFDQPIDNWNVGNVLSMQSMFKDAATFNQPLNGWNMLNVTTTTGMFQNALLFDQPLNNWAVGAITTMDLMFSNAEAFDQPLNNWNTGSVTDMTGMFANTDNFNQNLASWDISSVTDMANMLNNSALSQENYDNTLIGWAAQSVNSDVALGAANLNYCDGRLARQELIDNTSWTIDGDIINCTFVLCTPIISPLDGDTHVPSNFDLRWDPAPNATGYRVSVRRVNGGSTEIILDDSDVGNVVGVDFTNDFIPGDVVYATVVPYNAEGPATGCDEISFTVVPSWVDSPDAYKFTIDTREIDSGSSAIDQLRILARGDQTYNYSIDWGDHQFNNNVDDTITHTYLTPGIYTIAIIGDYPAHYYNSSSGDNDKLLSIDQWGSMVWQTMESAFYSCGGFTGYNAADVPDLSQVTDMSRMFESSNFNGNIDAWDVSTVTDMSRTFIGMPEFNQPLNSWNVSNVTTMSDMFLSTPKFNQPLNDWDVSNVTTMRRMFDGFNRDMAFNQPLNNWDVSNVTDMTTMFRNNIDFDQPLDQWNVSQVTSMEGMFEGAHSFNQNIDSWNVGSVNTMESMFNEATSFNRSLNSWNVSVVTNMGSMFRYAENFNQAINNWDVSTVTHMASMFEGATVFNQSIDVWNVSRVTNMNSMFKLAESYNSALNSWDVDLVVDMASMFEGAAAFDQALNSWNVNSVVNMSSMFKDAVAFNQPLANWNVSAVANMASMFQNAQRFDQPIDLWDVSSVTLMNSMFEDASIFNNPIGNWEVASVTQMDSMFKNASLFNSPLENWDTGEVLTMAEMFNGASAFDRPIDPWDVSFVTTMRAMFKDAVAYNQTMDSWNVASVSTMEQMFSGATAFNNTIDSWNVRGVNTMQEMFDGATSFDQTINNWRVTGVTNMRDMLRNASAYNQTMDRWNLGSVNMRSMFENATAFEQSLEDWDVSQVTDMTDMLDNTALSRENYDNTLIAWSEQALTAGITLGAQGLLYCDALEERQSMIDTFGWTIMDDILDCPVPECTQLVSPLDGDTAVPVNTNLAWEPVLYAREYRLTIRIEPGGTIINQTVVDDTSYGFASDFAGGETVYVTIVPSNDTGDAVGPCTEESFTISGDPATVPECTNLTDPLNTANDVAVNTDLSWNPIANADGYRLTVGTTAGGNTILDDEDVGNTTTYDFATDLPEDSAIFITIIPYNDVGDAAICTEESFRTEVIPVPPVCTNLTSPANGATDVPIDTDLTWSAVPNATGYLVTVGTTSGGIEVVNNVDVGNLTTYDFSEDLRENRTYFVTIIPYNDVGDASGCREESFRTGSTTLNDPPACTSLTGPVNGATDVAIGTDLNWNAAANSDGYRITAGTTLGGNEILNSVDVGNVTTYDIPTDLPEGSSIYVTIVPYNGFGDATGCTEESFTTEISASEPSCSALTYPLNGTGNVSTDTNMSWNAISTATGYRLAIGTTSGGTEIFTGDVGNTTMYDHTSDLPENTLIYVAITPYNAQGDATGCNGQSFMTGTLGGTPTCATLTGPVNEALNVAVNTNINWNNVDRADGYYLTIGTSSGGNDILNHQDVGILTSYDLPENLPEATTIYINITPYDASGITGCTEEWFTTGTSIPSCTTLNFPENGETDVPVDTAIGWNEIPEADGYLLSLGTTSGGTEILENREMGSSSDFVPNESFPTATTIFVNITPYNSEGEALGCSEQTFVTVPEPIIEDDTKYGFSPDGDGINEFWEIDGIENHPENVVSIYNRWGDMVFQIEGYDNRSNVFAGDANNLTGLGANTLPAGTYFFRIQISGQSTLKKLSGYLVLKR